MNQEKEWQSIDLHDDEDSETTTSGNLPKKFLQKNKPGVHEPQWRSDPYAHESRSHLVVFCMYLMAGLCLAYLLAGWSSIKSIDDVIKLLAPALQLVTTLLGAVIGYFLYQSKSST
jgi:hypothetical protein